MQNNGHNNTIFLNLLEKMFGKRMYHKNKSRDNYDLNYLEFIFSNKKLRLIAPRKDNGEMEEFGSQDI